MTRVYDAADRLIEERNDKGTVWRYDYNNTGQRIRRVVTPLNGLPETTQWRYERGRPIEINSPNASEHIQYDRRGLPIVRTVTLKIGAGAEVKHVTRYAYDPQGRLQSETLPDGTRIEYERNGQGQVTGVYRRAYPWLARRWMREALATRIERDLIGLTGLTFGNGIEAHWQRSREGVLARVVYRRPGTTRSRPVPTGVRTAALPANGLMQVLLPAAKAGPSTDTPPQSGANRTPRLPGAFGLRADPLALYDTRLLYDTAGNVLMQEDRGNAARTSRAYAYDSRDQLIAAEVGEIATPGITAVGASHTKRAWRYHYDPRGNRLLAQEEVPAAEMGRTLRMQFDPNSDAMLAAATDHEAVFNANGRLVALHQDGAELARYHYDHRGLRVAKTINGKTSYTLYNTARERIADLDAQGSIMREYVWLGGALIATLDFEKPVAPRGNDGLGAQVAETVAALWRTLTGHEARIAFVHVNYLGAPVGVTDENGDLLWRADYAPYGKLLTDSQSEQSADSHLRAHAFKSSTNRLLPFEGNTNSPLPFKGSTNHPLPFKDTPHHSLPFKGRVGEGMGFGKDSRKGQRSEEEYTLDLRYPGQWEDEESGLYYNDQRYYDPDTGRYLTPDPLGARAEALGSRNTYAYVNNNPTSYIDPWGLILFAFDGTGNSDPPQSGSNISNVVKFRDLYDDGDLSYVTGVGTRDPKTGIEHPLLLGGNVADAGFALTGGDRIEKMIENLQEYSNTKDDDVAFDIDTIGFSRGAAFARDFANEIADATTNGYYQYTDDDGNKHCQKVNLRFMGLFDTVLSTHAGSYNLGIPADFDYVAQAVALNEYRSGVVAFPLESIMGGAIPAGQTRIERGFLGSHSDIGGGFPEDDLAKVALNWMVDQATRAGVNMKTGDLDRSIIANPVLHDKSSNLTTGGPGLTGEDRDVRYLDGTVAKQRQANTFGMNWTDTSQFITLKPLPKESDNIAGTVDMRGYLNWLNAHGNNLPMTVQ